MTRLTRGEINDIVADFARANPDYREALLANPKATLGAQLGCALPPWLRVEVLQETADTIFLVLPHSLPEDVTLDVLSDQAVFIKAAIAEVRDAAILGGLLAIAVLYLFLRQIKSTLIVSVSIPVSIEVGFELKVE